MDRLNENERKVLKAMVDNANYWNGGDFGFTEELSVPGLSRHQVSGYMSDLQTKGYIQVHDRATFTVTRKEG